VDFLQFKINSVVNIDLSICIFTIFWRVC